MTETLEIECKNCGEKFSWPKEKFDDQSTGCDYCASRNIECVKVMEKED
jgi:formylmethanofuran dehydrogenase subunit E